MTDATSEGEVSQSIEQLENDEAVRCYNPEEDLRWYFTLEGGGEIWRWHDREGIEPRQVSRSMAQLSIGADVVQEEIVCSEAIE